MMRHMAVLGLALAGAMVSALALAAPLSLDAAVASALRNNADLSLAQSRLQEARATRAKLRTAWMPNVQAVGSYTRNSVEAKFDSGALIKGIASIVAPGAVVPADKLPEPSYIQRYDQLSGVLQVDQTLFALSPLLLAKAADAGLTAQTTALDAARREIVFAVHQIFYQYAGIKRLAEVADRAIALSEQRIALVRQRKDAGADSQLALLRAEAERDRALQDRLAAQSGEAQLLVLLRTLTGSESVDALDVPPPQPLPAGTPERWSTEAKSQRPDLQAKEQAVVAARLQVDEARWRWVPTLALQGQARWSNVKGFAGQSTVWLATANLIVPLFDRGQRYADAREREAAVVRAEHERAKAERDLDGAIDQARVEWTQADAQLALSRTQAERARQTAQVVAAAYAAGGATSLEVAEADTQLRVSEAMVERQRLNVDLALLRLRHLVGQLVPPAS